MLVLASQHSEVGCGPAALVLSGHLGSEPQGLSFSRGSSSWPFVLGKVGFYLLTGRRGCGRATLRRRRQLRGLLASSALSQGTGNTRWASKPIWEWRGGVALSLPGKQSRITAQQDTPCDYSSFPSNSPWDSSRELGTAPCCLVTSCPRSKAAASPLVLPQCSEGDGRVMRHLEFTGEVTEARG